MRQRESTHFRVTLPALVITILLAAVVHAAPPTITQQPVDVLADAGDTVVFTLDFIPDPNLADPNVEWFRSNDFANDTPGDDTLIGPGDPNLQIVNVQLADDGYYYARVSNADGSDDSDVVRLNIKQLVGFWQLNQNFVDDTGNGWDGVGDPNFFAVGDGIDADAYEFTGDGRVVEIPDTEVDFNFYPTGITVSCWVRTTQNDWGGFVTKESRNLENGQALEGWALEHFKGTVYFSIRKSGAYPAVPHGFVESTTRIHDAQWHMVTGTFDADTRLLMLYVDGQYENQDGPLLDFPTEDVPVIFGANHPTGAFSYNGQLDQVRIYNYPLSATEIATLYSNLAGSFCISLPPVDLNGDCVVDMVDFGLLAAGWMDCNLFPDCISEVP